MSNIYYLLFKSNIDINEFNKVQRINNIDITINWKVNESIPNFYFSDEQIYNEQIVLLHTKKMFDTKKYMLMRQIGNVITIPNSYGILS
jgi:hypothetical protein